MRWRKRRADDADERGAAVVELGVVLPFLALLVLGTLDLGRAFRLQSRLENAAREGAAYAQYHPSRASCAGDDDAEARATAEDPGLAALDGYRVTVSNDGTTLACTSSVAPGERVVVRVESSFDVLTPLVEAVVGGSVAVRGSAEVVVQG